MKFARDAGTSALSQTGTIHLLLARGAELD